MKIVNVATLKEQLSKYLHEAESGGEVVVTSHRRPIAKLTEYGRGSANIRKPLRPASDIRKVKGVSMGGGKTSLGVLEKDRRKR